jgi:hypothetical protein
MTISFMPAIFFHTLHHTDCLITLSYATNSAFDDETTH